MLPAVVLILLFSHALCGDIPPEFVDLAATLHKLCQDKIGVEESSIIDARKGIFPPNDAKLKCYMGCVFEEMSLFHDDGTIDMVTIIESVPESIKGYADTVKECGTQMGSDNCDTAYKTMQCYYAKDPATFFVF